MTDEIISRGEKTRQDIVQAAFDLFSRQGYHATSMRQVAESAGIALGGIYNHFANKEEMFVQVLLEHHPIYEVLPELDHASGETLPDFVADAARLIAGRFGEDLDFLNLILIEMVEFNGSHLDQLFKLIFPRLLTFGQKIQTWQGDLRPIPVPILMRSFVGVFFAYVVTEFLIGKSMPGGSSQDALDHFIEIYLHGIMKEKTV
jgi:AcrR family transcriptional regulator